MTLNDRNAPIYQISLLSGARCVNLNEDKLILSAEKDCPGSVDFSNLQVIHKFAGMIP